VSGRDGAIGDHTAVLSAVLYPPFITAACRLQVYPKATELSLIRPTGLSVIGDTLVAITAGPAKHCFLQRVQLILGCDAAAVIKCPVLNVAATPCAEATNSRCVVNWEFHSSDAAAALVVGRDAPVLVITICELQGATNAADLAGAKTARQIHAVDSTSTITAITTP